MSAVADGVLVYASDPTPTAGELVFDFVAGQIHFVVALPTDAGATNADAAVATGAGAAGTASTTVATASGAGAGAGAGNAATGTLAITAESPSAVGAANDASVTTAGSSSPTALIAAATGTAFDATTASEEPEPPAEIPTLTASMPMPRLSNAGRIVPLKLTADLGDITAHINVRVELADEELIELL